MKKAAVLLVIVIMSFTLVACANNSQPATPDPEPANSGIAAESGIAETSGPKVITDVKILVGEGIVWGEGPRWVPDEKMLYFADIMGMKVMRTDLKGSLETVVEVPGMPTVGNYLPDGRLLVTSGLDGTLYTLEDGKLVEYVNIYKELPGTMGINDIVISEDGNVYVGCYGYDITQYTGGEAPGWIALITPDKKVLKMAENEVKCPNGMAITADGKKLIAGDTIARVLLSWDIAADGSLSNTQLFAQLEDGPDGICLDAEGAVWAALPETHQVVRVLEGGEITHIVKMENKPLACMLGGVDRTTLFIVTVVADEINNPDAVAGKVSFIEYVENIQVPGAGRP